MRPHVALPVTLLLLALSVTVGLAACGDDGGSDGELTCDPTERPVVLVHGLLAASDTWQRQALRFRANGYCDTHVVALDWNTFAQDGAEAQLDALVDATLAATGATQVDLVGHSAGGGLGYRYLADPVRAAKVAHYVHCASGQTDPPAPAGPAGAPVPTLNLWSDGDTVVTTGAMDVAGVTDVQTPGEDHYQVATSAASFTAMWSFLHDGLPTPTTTPDERGATLAGKALTLGENAPVAGGEVRIWEVDAATAARTTAAPLATFAVGADGAWGPFEATRDARYELVLVDPNAARPVHYYTEGVRGVRRFTVLRSFPAEGLVAALLANIPFDDAHAVAIVFSSSQAVVHGRDTLTFDDEDLATEVLAAPEITAIAYFLFDEGTDQVSSGPTDTFSALVPFFLDAVDRYLPASTEVVSVVTFDGREIRLPHWPSDTAGPVVALFD